MIEIVLTAAALIGVAGVARMLLAIHAVYWYNARYEEVERMSPFDHDKFHEIQNRRKPIGIRVSDWLEVHHI